MRTWRVRFADGGLAALADRRRCSRPRRFTPVQVAEVKALACQLPAETGTPLSRWSCPELAREVVVRRIADSISASTVRRWLRDDTLKPWQYRSWIFIRDPKFRPKAARIMDLYAGRTGNMISPEGLRAPAGLSPAGALRPYPHRRPHRHRGTRSRVIACRSQSNST
ncbi:helix-turn-helix domain-containing protein [Streptomyces sp. NPDC058231]|uniref:helix-turn-helix domain-containing protein n=1 Tax=Streptomyces sp. NPDC058231 TaxID=3346392 RepID=UPI0036EB9898